eukprot:484362-Amphidinium_carterae.1
MDIEGAEYPVLMHLMRSGLVCWVDKWALEWHRNLRVHKQTSSKYYQAKRLPCGLKGLMDDIVGWGSSLRRLLIPHPPWIEGIEFKLMFERCCPSAHGACVCQAVSRRMPRQKNSG